MQKETIINVIYNYNVWWGLGLQNYGEVLKYI